MNRIFVPEKPILMRSPVSDIVGILRFVEVGANDKIVSVETDRYSYDDYDLDRRGIPVDLDKFLEYLAENSIEYEVLELPEKTYSVREHREPTGQSQEMTLEQIRSLINELGDTRIIIIGDIDL